MAPARIADGFVASSNDEHSEPETGAVARLPLRRPALLACATNSGAAYVPSAKSCDPTGDSDARRACNH